MQFKEFIIFFYLTLNIILDRSILQANPVI